MISLLILVLNIPSGGLPPDGSGFMDIAYKDLLNWADSYHTYKYIDPLFMAAIATQESQLQDDAISSAGAMGIFQFMPITVKDISERFGYPFDPYDARQATEAAKIYLTWLCDRLLDEDTGRLIVYLNDPNIKYPHDIVLIAWNWGYGNLQKYINSRVVRNEDGSLEVKKEGHIKLPTETKTFISKVNMYYTMLVFTD